MLRLVHNQKGAWGMIKESVRKFVGVAAGERLPAFAWPGGYPIIYYAGDGACFCAACVNGENGSDAPDANADDPQWTIEAADVYYEGPAESCAHCGAAIESAYGDPDAPDPSTSQAD